MTETTETGTVERGTGFYDRTGQRVDVLKWATLFEDFAYRLVADDSIVLPGACVAHVRTVWSGIRDAHMDERLFCTGYKIGEGVWSTVEQYDTEDAATVGHHAVVKRIAAPGYHVATRPDD